MVIKISISDCLSLAYDYTILHIVSSSILYMKKKSSGAHAP